MPGVEPGSQAWEACMIPLHYMRSARWCVNRPSFFSTIPSLLRSIVWSMSFDTMNELGTTCLSQANTSFNIKGLLRELNPGPLAPEARIMPLDQAASCISMVANRGQELLRTLAKVSSTTVHNCNRFKVSVITKLRGRELNPGLPRDRRKY